MNDRVCYFSNNDLSLGHYLEVAEKRIQEVAGGNIPTDLEGIIELWHIKRMFENNCRLHRWTDAEFKKLKSSTYGYNAIIANFFNGLNSTKIKSEFELLEWTYKKTFWEIIDAYKLYRLIEPETLRSIISENINYLHSVLECKGVVEKFKTVIREELLNKVNSAHVILDKYVAKRDLHGREELYLPSNLSLDDKEQILLNYLKSDNPNLNYVRLITQIKDNKNQIQIDPKTRLLAERLEKKLNKELLSDPRTSTIHRSIGVQFIDEEGRPAIELIINEKGNPTYTYSIPYIRNQKNIQRVGNCISLFEWLNNHYLLNLINKRTEVDFLESTLINFGRDSYPAHFVFNNKNKLALYQMFAYTEVLRNRLNSSFEAEIKLFYEEYLNTQYGYPGLAISLPSSDDSTLNKCRVLCPELDFIVNQYTTFVEEDEIDIELISILKPLKVEDGKSLLINKYYQITEGNNDIWKILWGLFGSGNSLLYYVKPFEDKHYRSLIDLLRHEDFLIEQKIIEVDEEGYLHIVSDAKIEILRSLWEYDVCSYWHYDDISREILDEMLNKGWLKTDDHLLSKPERDYFSYYLDNRMFANSLAYRNHYMHGSTPPVNDENAHLIAYHTFLRLVAIIILKIEDDLWLANRALAIYAVNKTKEQRYLKT